MSVIRPTLEMALKTLELVSTVGDNFRTFQAVFIPGTKALICPALAVVAPFVGSAKLIQPGKKHAEVMMNFKKLHRSIDEVRDDIKNLEKMMKWEATKLQYQDVERRITQGLGYAYVIGSSRDEKDKQGRYKERLLELGANQDFNLAVEILINGLTGEAEFQNNILESYYQQPGSNIPAVRKLASRMVQLLYSGLVTLMVHEHLKRGEGGIADVLEEYTPKEAKAIECTYSTLEKCGSEVDVHIQKDLENILDDNMEKEKDYIGHEIMKYMKQYNWLEVFCMVYDHTGMSEYYTKDNYHFFTGRRVEIINRHDKCVVLYFMQRGESSDYSKTRELAKSIIDGVPPCIKAIGRQSDIELALERKSVDTWGIATVYCRMPSIMWTGQSCDKRKIVSYFDDDSLLHSFVLLK